MNHFTPFLGMSPPARQIPKAALGIALLCAVQFGCGVIVGMMLGEWPAASSATIGIWRN